MSMICNTVYAVSGASGVIHHNELLHSLSVTWMLIDGVFVAVITSGRAGHCENLARRETTTRA